jgi:hypothetical protein
MKIEINGHVCTVTKEPGDSHFGGVINAAGESRLLYHIKKILNTRGYDLIKKRAYKDGHLMDEMQQYLRTRKPSGSSKKDVYIYSPFFAIEGADEALNREGQVRLSVVTDIFNKKED